MRTFDCYRLGQFNGQGPVLWMFRYYRPDGSFGSCEVAEDRDAKGAALAAIGMRQSSEAERRRMLAAA